ncbi:MAG: DUF554 domain-containing protein [Verrucomicrobiales bacterium]|nr:DUF554 domain-containing protein [Verrucomicrobiota bacterium JB025]
MLPTGSLVNAAAIIAGALVGCWLQSRFPDRIRTIVFQGLGLSTLLIGGQMALKTQNTLIVIFAILLGGITGELLRIDSWLERAGNRFKGLVRSDNKTFTEGLVHTSLLFCIGAMAIIGSLEEGISGDPTVIYTKSIMDGFAAIAFAATYGSGVIYSFIPVLIYQGAMTLGAGFLKPYASDLMIAQISGCGGLLIMAIAINLLEVAKIRLTNLLPAIIYVAILTAWFG